MSALPPKADIKAGCPRRPLMTQSRHSALLTNVGADDATGEAGQDRRQGGQPWQVRHISACRGGDSTAAVRRNPATDRRPATTDRADMTPCVIAAAGLNRRVPGSRHLPNERLQIPDCTLAGSERLTGALLDRITHHVHILEMNGESYRLKQCRSQQATKARLPANTACPSGPAHGLRGKA